MRRMGLALETARARRGGKRAVAPAPVAMPLGKMRVEDEAVPARREGRPVGERPGTIERRANLRAGDEGEAPVADGFGERVDAARTGR